MGPCFFEAANCPPVGLQTGPKLTFGEVAALQLALSSGRLPIFAGNRRRVWKGRAPARERRFAWICMSARASGQGAGKLCCSALDWSSLSPLQSKVWPKSSGWNCVFGSKIASGRL